MEPIIKLMEYSVQSNIQSTREIPTGVKQIKAPEFWDKSEQGKGRTIAVIDTGCQTRHLDLQGRIIGGRNFTNEDGGNPNVYEDYNGHGTHVAGIIAAVQNNRGVVGVAPQAKLLILKVLGKYGQGSYESLVQAIYYAIEQKVDIITMSLGGPRGTPALHKAIQEAVNQDIPVVCAAANNGDGNAGTSEYAYPAYYQEVIAVGAVDSRYRVARFSNSNDQIDLVAPGVNILSTYLVNRYAYMTGTSMAAPHAAGALALIANWGRKEYGRELTELELYTQLIKHTISLGIPKSLEGNGMLYLELLERIKRIQNYFR